MTVQVEVERLLAVLERIGKHCAVADADDATARYVYGEVCAVFGYTPEALA